MGHRVRWLRHPWRHPRIMHGAICGDYLGGFGFGHLWFIFVLLLVAVIALPLLANRGSGGALLAGLSRRLAHPAWWPLAALLICAGEALPAPTGALTPFYLVVVCDPAFMKSAERYRLPALAIGVLGALASWLVIVGLLGYGRRRLDRTSPALSYLGEVSYPVYLLHQTVIVIAAFYVVDLTAAGTFALYEVVRRTRVTRWAFGMKPLQVRAGAQRASASTSIARPTPCPCSAGIRRALSRPRSPSDRRWSLTLRAPSWPE